MIKKASLFILALLLTLSASASIRVMSYNIRLGVAKDGDNAWEIRKDATPAMLRDIHPAVFGVQEAYDFQVAYILEQCPEYKAVGVGRDDGVEQGEHMSVFYDTNLIELLEWGTYWLSETPDVPSFGWDAKCRRTATWTLLREIASGQKFYFVNTHLDHRGAVARKEGLALIYNRIQAMNPDGVPMVLTGDFNVLTDDECLADISTLMKSARFNSVDADTIGSFNGFGAYGNSSGAPTIKKKNVKLNELQPIDYIYYSGFDQSLCFKVVTQTYADRKYISDHYPIYSDLVLKASRIESGAVASKILGVDKQYKVYLPEGYDLNPEKRYPVLYLLHGAKGSCNTWSRNYNMKVITDWRMTSGFSVPMIIVMPDASGDGPDNVGRYMGYFNYEGWRYEDFFFEEFIPEIESRYRIAGDAGHRAIAGLSMGGHGTALFAMHRPQYFSSACPLSGRLKGRPNSYQDRPEMQEYLDQVAANDMPKYLKGCSEEQQKAISAVRWYIDCGDDDYLVAGSLDLWREMKKLRFPCAQLRVREGTHNQEYWRTALPDVLTFVSIGFAE
ncbi:MAG: hypothetical protein J5640_07965 [Bacteroidales bacterium]|nr:hypothetical protein [Bacteroidales bacterium]